MVEAADPRVASDLDRSDEAGHSPATLKAAIRETRGRIASRLDDTTERLAALFIAPSENGGAPREPGIVGLIATSVATAGRTRRAWMYAKSSGLVTKTTAAAALIGVVSIVAVVRSRRKRHTPALEAEAV
jgi:hypothetical protein